jgi:hypothetical protein
VLLETPVDIPSIDHDPVVRRWVWRWIVSDALPVFGVFVQLALAAFVMRQGTIFTSGFRRVFYLATVPFLGHHFLPHRLRLRAFGLLCIGALLVAMGGSRWCSGTVQERLCGAWPSSAPAPP